MRFLIYTFLLAAIITAPFVVTKRPWALGFWRRVRLVIVIYALVVFLSAVVRLVTGWGDIYG
jgi:hypothetical protein